MKFISTIQHFKKSEVQILKLKVGQPISFNPSFVSFKLGYKQNEDAL